VIEFTVRLVKEKPLGTISGLIVLVLFLAGLLADLITPYPMEEIHLADAFHPPCRQYIFGTDDLGRDVFSRVIYGARVSMYVGLAASVISVAVSTFIGLLSGFLGGKFDIVMQRFVDAWMCFPALFLALSFMAVIGPGLVPVILVLGIQRGIGGSRIIRSAVMTIKQNVYVEAARGIGAPTSTILIRHILPNIMAPIIILLSISVGGMILAEARLSFLGYSIPPPTPSWGAMISGTGRENMLVAPWMVLWPGVALALVVYGVNMFGDALRDLLDPRLRGGLGRYGGGVQAKGKKRRRRLLPNPSGILKILID